MGIICQKCTNKENDEDDSFSEKDIISPKNCIMATNIKYTLNNEYNKLCFEEEENNKSYKIDESFPKFSKSSNNLIDKQKNINIDERVNNLLLGHNSIILEEENEDEIKIEKKISKSTLQRYQTKKKENRNKILHLADDLNIEKKEKPNIPFVRRKKKSSTVKQNTFLFAQIFSSEICMPISQENLIWEKKGFPKNNYIRGKLLGKGAFGEVYESKNPIFNNKVAMKIIKKNKEEVDDFNNDINKNEDDLIKSEINILKKLSHPNIVRIYEFYESDNCFYLINEFCKMGQLDDYLKNNILTEDQLCVIFYQVFSGLIYLHENNIIHGDLKPENIMISSIEKNIETNEDYVWIKIIDFGTAKIFKKSIVKGDNIVGTLYYIAPEVFASNIEKYDEKSDIWSIGVILYKTITKKYPFRGTNDLETIQYIMEKEYDKNNQLLLGYSDELQDLIKNLLMKDSNQRPSAKEALNHKWFKKFDGRRLFTNFKKDEMKPFIDNLCNFSFSKIHQLVIAFLVHNLPETESSQKILKLFRYFNQSGNCELSKEELKNGLKEFKEENEIEEKFDNIFRELDGDNNGTIEFEEFLRACINKDEILNDNYLKYAFKFLDKENKKMLSPEQIISAFLSKENDELKETINEIMNKSDYDKNGMINFEEFKNLINFLDKLK